MLVRRFFCFLAVAGLFLLPEITTAKTTQLNLTEVKSLVLPYLARGETIVHNVFRGSFGPSSDSLIVLTERNDYLGGFVLSPDGKGGYLKYKLPAYDYSEILYDNSRYPYLEVQAIFFENIDADESLEIFLMVSCVEGNGSFASFTMDNFVFDWAGTGFTRLKFVESKIAGLSTAKEIRRILKKK